MAAAAFSIVATASPDPYANIEEEAEPYDVFHVSTGAALVVPQGGASSGRLGGGFARGGFYLSEFTALEGTFSVLENRYGASGGILWHWYGYERLDPFFVYGGSWIEGLGAGPSAGIGFHWHLDDHWSLRADCTYALAIDGGVDSVFSFSAGIRVSW